MLALLLPPGRICLAETEIENGMLCNHHLLNSQKSEVGSKAPSEPATVSKSS
jgi:hypothetical protein